jgi:hypothetical protein
LEIQSKPLEWHVLILQDFDLEEFERSATTAFYLRCFPYATRYALHKQTRFSTSLAGGLSIVMLAAVVAYLWKKNKWKQGLTQECIAQLMFYSGTKRLLAYEVLPCCDVHATLWHALGLVPKIFDTFYEVLIYINLKQ